MKRPTSADRPRWSADLPRRRPPSIVGRPVKPGFVEMLNPGLVTKPPSGPKWAHEIKWDGYRAQAHVRGNRVQMFTRQGNDWTSKFGPISEVLPKLRVDNVILDGEVVTIGKNGLSDFHGLRHELGTMLPNIVYQAFDLLCCGWTERICGRGRMSSARRG